MVLLFSSLLVSHLAGIGFIFIVLSASYVSLQFLLCLWMWGIFFWWAPELSWGWFSTASSDFGALAGDESLSFYSAILNQKLSQNFDI